MMTPLQKIRTSFTTQLSLWVACFVVLTSGTVIFLLARFSEDVIREETVDTTMQTLENTALRIDNALRQTETTARLEHRRPDVDWTRMARLVDEGGGEGQPTGLAATLRQWLPNAKIVVTRRGGLLSGADGGTPSAGTVVADSAAGWRQLADAGGRQLYVFTQPLGDGQFCIAAVCPASDIHGRYVYMQRTLLTWGLAAVAVLIGVLCLVVRRHLRPLHRLADAAQAIARGDLDTMTAGTRHRDETGRLQSSLATMQQRLRVYMAEMQQKQDMLNGQQAELQAAYAEAKAYEEKKAVFLHDMTQQMAKPVERLCRSTDAVCRDYPNLPKNDMAALQADIIEDSETIVGLLDQLIKEPASS